MPEHLFKINSRMEIEIEHGPYIGTYSSRIEEVKEDELEIAIPSKQGHLLPLPVGTCFIGKVVRSNSMYIFKANIKHVALKQHVPTWTIRKPEVIEKIQRRDFVRMDVRLPASLKIQIENENILSIEGKNYSAKELENIEYDVNTKDLSGSGAKIITKFNIPEETKVLLTIQIPERGPFHTLAKVIRSDLINPELGIYWVVVHFIGLSERERDKIVHFIFKKQVELRKRSLL
jgi:c-di-GMP-binding flagellar brake protein YcgR